MIRKRAWKVVRRSWRGLEQIILLGAPCPLGAGGQRSAPLEPVVLSFGCVRHCNPRGTRIAGHG
jgi:hypothetical protein